MEGCKEEFKAWASCAREEKSALGSRELHRSSTKTSAGPVPSLSAAPGSLWHLWHLRRSRQKSPCPLLTGCSLQGTLLTGKKTTQKQTWHNINWSLVIYVCFLFIQTNSIPFWIFYDACYSLYTWFISCAILWIIPNADVFVFKDFAETWKYFSLSVKAP